MAEADFQTELNRGILHVGGHGYKIPDLPYELAKRANYRERKPYDCYWAFQGVWNAMELKQVRKGLSFNLSELATHQEENLLAVEATGFPGWLIVNFRVSLGPLHRKKYGVELIDRAFAARIKPVVHARTREARTGLDFDWFLEHGTELVRFDLPGVDPATSLAWDPRPLVERVREDWRAA